jgi:hypothetical protein
LKRLLLLLACTLAGAADSWVQPFPTGALQSAQPPVGAYFPAQIDSSELRMTVDGRDVTGESHRETGRILWTPSAPLPPGAHAATLSGPGMRRTWSFTVGGSSLSSLQPSPAQGEVASLLPVIALRFSAPVQKVRLLLDGLEVGAQAPSGGDAVRYVPPRPLPAGSHAVQVFAKGADGALLEKSWTFVASPKAGANTGLLVEPAPGGVSGAPPRIRFALPPGKTHERFTLLLDGADLTDACVQLGRFVELVPRRPLGSGTHKVSVRTRATDGTELERTWSFTVR